MQFFNCIKPLSFRQYNFNAQKICEQFLPREKIFKRIQTVKLNNILKDYTNVVRDTGNLSFEIIIIFLQTISVKCPLYLFVFYCYPFFQDIFCFSYFVVYMHPSCACCAQNRGCLAVKRTWSHSCFVKVFVDFKPLFFLFSFNLLFWSKFVLYLWTMNIWTLRLVFSTGLFLFFLGIIIGNRETTNIVL